MSMKRPITPIKQEQDIKHYRKIKLLPEVITVIKHALVAFETTELRIEKQMALACFSHDDYFLNLYVGDKRKHISNKTKTKIKEGEQVIPL